MKRIKILNKRIEKYFQKKNDQDLMTKLKTIKPVVNIKCPESYIFYKTQFLSYQTEPRKTKKLAVVKKNASSIIFYRSYNSSFFQRQQ